MLYASGGHGGGARDDLRWWGDRTDVLLCVRRRTGGERAFVCVLPGASTPLASLLLASLFVQILGLSEGKQL